MAGLVLRELDPHVVVLWVLRGRPPEQLLGLLLRLAALEQVRQLEQALHVEGLLAKLSGLDDGLLDLELPPQGRQRQAVN